MEKKLIVDALNFAKDNSPKRKFSQTADLIINFKDINLKNPENHLNLFILLKFSTGRDNKICGLVGHELSDQSKEAFDTTITIDDFEKYQKDPKAAKKLAEEHDYFVAQATIMPKVASTFGRILGSRGKMPNPKAGCVVAPGSNLTVLAEKLKKTAKVIVKNTPHMQCKVGKEDQPIDQVADNILNIYNTVLHALPNEENNIKNVMVKFTMGKPVLADKNEITSQKQDPKNKSKTTSSKNPAEAKAKKTEAQTSEEERAE